MYKSRWKMLVGLIFASLINVTFAQEQAVKKEDNIKQEQNSAKQEQDNAKIAAIEEYLKVTKMEEFLNSQVDIITEQEIKRNPLLTSHKAEIKKLYSDMLNYPEFKKFAIKLYSDNFTESELKEITKFYQSPIGEKLLAKMPIMTQEVMNYVINTLGKNEAKFRELNEKIMKEENEKRNKK